MYVYRVYKVFDIRCINIHCFQVDTATAPRQAPPTQPGPPCTPQGHALAATLGSGHGRTGPTAGHGPSQVYFAPQQHASTAAIGGGHDRTGCAGHVGWRVQPAVREEEDEDVPRS